MSITMSGATKIQEMMDTARGMIKNRRPPQRPMTMRATSSRQSTLIPVPVRPRSGSRNKEESKRQDSLSVRSARSHLDKFTPTSKALSTNKTANRKSDVITVPISQKVSSKLCYYTPNTELPDQETINKSEDMELRNNDDTGSTSCNTDEDTSLKSIWQEKLSLYENMKNELVSRQNAIIDLYGTLFNTHRGMESLGQKTILPPAEELRIMNLAKITSEQLMPLLRKEVKDCCPQQGNGSIRNDTDIDELFSIPVNLVATCEETLNKRQAIIEWFRSLSTNQKKISISALSMKVNEFHEENEMLRKKLENNKCEFVTHLNKIVDVYRQQQDEIVNRELRTDELTYEISEMSSLNIDLRKQLQHSENMKSQITRNKLENLEKELKSEKCKRAIFKDRLNRTEAQLAEGKKKIAQLEDELQLAQEQVSNHKQDLQNITAQNKKLYADFNEELGKLTNLIVDNTKHLNEISDARDNLQMEKEDLQKRLEELSENYKASTNEMNKYVAKISEADQKFSELLDEKTILEVKLKALSTQLDEAENRYEDASKLLQEQETMLGKFVESDKELVVVRREMESRKQEVEDYKVKLKERDEVVRNLERKLEECAKKEEILKDCIKSKDNNIVQLENNMTDFKQQIEYSENKMANYEEQLTALKEHIGELQEEFGEFENLNELQAMIHQQQTKLLEATRHNGEVTETVLQKEAQIERHLQKLAEQNRKLEERDGVIKTLTDKENEQANIIKLLRNNLEIRAHADCDLSQQLTEKSDEIYSLTNIVQTKKKQISQLEKIILTQEEQAKRFKIQSKMDEEKINILKNKLTKYESYLKTCKPFSKSSTEKLDSFLQLFEQELDNYEPQLNKTESKMKTKTYPDDRRNRDHKIGFDCDRVVSPMYEAKHMMAMPTKIVMGNFVKRTYVPNTTEEHYKNENLDRKKAITNIDSHPWNSDREQDFKTYAATTRNEFVSKDYFTKKLPLLSSNPLRDDKKSKMLKFAGHRL